MLNLRKNRFQSLLSLIVIINIFCFLTNFSNKKCNESNCNNVQNGQLVKKMTATKCAQVYFATGQNKAEFGRKVSLNNKTF
jgi:hypothetical protein